MAAKYVAVLSADVCAIHDWSDSVNILRRIFSVKANNVVVTRFFGTQNEALCWLTIPLHTDAVACGAAALEPASLQAPSGGHQWLAMVSRSISSCVRLDAAGLGMTVGALRETTDGAFVLRRFPSADDARRWVNTPTALSLLNVVCCVPPVEDKASTSLPKDGSATVMNIDLDQQTVCWMSIRGVNKEPCDPFLFPGWPRFHLNGLCRPRSVHHLGGCPAPWKVSSSCPRESGRC